VLWLKCDSGDSCISNWFVISRFLFRVSRYSHDSKGISQHFTSLFWAPVWLRPTMQSVAFISTSVTLPPSHRMDRLFTARSACLHQFQIPPSILVVCTVSTMKYTRFHVLPQSCANDHITFRTTTSLATLQDVLSCHRRVTFVDPWLFDASWYFLASALNVSVYRERSNNMEIHVQHHLQPNVPTLNLSFPSQSSFSPHCPTPVFSYHLFCPLSSPSSIPVFFFIPPSCQVA
jgi:hypothetical protein